MEKLLLTGGSGFLGKNVMPVLREMYDVVTCGRTPGNMIVTDLATEVPMLDQRYDLVLHAAGRAHIIPGTEDRERAFFDVNYFGTVHLCEALEKAGVPRALVFISTVAVYGCESGELITEEHPLDGDTPYAMSKIMAEKYLSEWCLKHNVILGVLRPSLLAGRNAPGNLGAIVEGVKKGYYMNVGGGNVSRSVLMAEDIGRIFPLLVEMGGVYNVCDTYHPSFRQISESVAKQLGKRNPVSVPYWIAKCMAVVGDCIGDKAPINSPKLKKMTKNLTFSNENARRMLNWEPLDVLTHFRI